MLKLPPRLMAIAGFIKAGAFVADVGTDHGYLPVYLAQNGLASGIIASDISAASLMSARRSADKYGVSEKIAFIAAPGLDGIEGTGADTVVIAGLGGETIAGILERSPWAKHGGVRFILQPQSKNDELCAFLRGNGYSLLDAKLAKDNGKFYVVILAVYGKPDSALGLDSTPESDTTLKPDSTLKPDIVPEPYPKLKPDFALGLDFTSESDTALKPELELLALLMNKRDPLFPGYLDRLIAKAGRVLEATKKTNTGKYLQMSIKAAQYAGLKRECENADC